MFLQRLKAAGPTAIFTTFVVGGTVAVVNAYAPEIAQVIDIESAAAGAAGAAIGVGGTLASIAFRNRKPKPKPKPKPKLKRPRKAPPIPAELP